MNKTVISVISGSVSEPDRIKRTPDIRQAGKKWFCQLQSGSEKAKVTEVVVLRLTSYIKRCIPSTI